MCTPRLLWLLNALLLASLSGCSTVTQPPDQAQAASQSSQAATATLHEVRIGLAGAPVALFGKEGSPTFDLAFQQLADHGFDFFFPVFVIHEAPEQSSYSTHGNYFFPAALTGAPIEQSCGGPFSPYTASLGKINIWYPGIQLLGLFDKTRPISEQDFLNALAVHENECADIKRAVSAFYSFDEPSLNRVVAHFSGQSPAASGNEATVARLVRQAWDVPVFIVDAPDESTIQTTGLPPRQMDKAVEMFWNDVREVASSQDGYGFNVYSIPDFRLTMAGDYCHKAMEAAPNQSIVSVIQGMSFAGITGDPNGGRAPTESEVRFQAIESLIAGANILCWYGCSSLDLNLQRDQELWSSPCYLQCVGLGSEAGIAVDDFFANLAVHASTHAYLGCYQWLKSQDSVKQYLNAMNSCIPANSSINTIIAAALESQFGDRCPPPLKTRGLDDGDVLIHPLLTLCFYFGLRKVLDSRLFVEECRGATGLADLDARFDTARQRLGLLDSRGQYVGPRPFLRDFDELMHRQWVRSS